MNDTIKKLFNEVFEELDGAEHYAHEAIRLHDIDKERSATFLEMSKQEVAHAEKLHDMIKREMAKHDMSANHALQEVYDWMRDRMLNYMAKVKHLQEFYR